MRMDESIKHVANGHKIFRLTIPRNKIGYPKTAFIDTLNFVRMPLGILKKNFLV